jgi:hypothetical protein
MRAGLISRDMMGKSMAARGRLAGARSQRTDRGPRPDTAFFDMSTDSVATVRKLHAEVMLASG